MCDVTTALVNLVEGLVGLVAVWVVTVVGILTVDSIVRLFTERRNK